MKDSIIILIILFASFAVFASIMRALGDKVDYEEPYLHVDNDTKELLLKKRDKSMYDREDLELQEECENYIFEEEL